MPDKSMGAAAFKERCLQILDELPQEGIVITKRGKAIARIMPIARSNAELIGCLKGKARIVGDVLDTGAVWGSDEENL